MTRFLAILSILFLVVSCDTSTEPAPNGGKTAEAPKPAAPASVAAPASPKATEKPASALGDIAGQAQQAIEKGGANPKAVDQVKETAAKTEEAAKGATQDVAALANVADQSFSVAKLKEALGSLKPDQIKGLADKLLAAVQNQQGVLAGLKEEAGKLSPTDLGKLGEITKNLQSAGSTLSGLKEKLGVVVDSLKASGVDVSKYTAFLTGK